MKKQIKAIGFLFVILFLSIISFGQKSATIQVIDSVNKPTIDGEISEWVNIPKYEITQNWMPGTVLEQTVSMVTGTVATWSAVWDDNNIYVLVEVPDDDFYPSEESGLVSWVSDKPELYFDVVHPKVDGGGPAAGSGAPGHYQVAHDVFEARDGMEMNGATAAYWVSEDSTNYAVEYKIPFAGIAVDGFNFSDELGSMPYDPKILQTIGFDVTVIDLDEKGKGRTVEQAQRVNYSNDVLIEESWSNMDYSANLTLEGVCLAVDSIYEKVTLCDESTYNYFGQTFTESGMFKVNVRKECTDRYLDLSMNKSYSSDTYASIFNGDSYEGFSAGGIHPIVHTAETGCDSIININLSVIDSLPLKLLEVSPSYSVFNTTVFSTEVKGDVEISSINESIQVSLFPNPVNSFVNLSSTTIIEDVVIVGLDGKIVLKQNVNSINASVDVSTLLSGTYVLQVNSDIGTTIKTLVVD